ncbi:MAG TPA: STAS domain-containing protein [Actinospica sp.]|nr:STAS domain-containing protein [Actinospica sp.]
MTDEGLLDIRAHRHRHAVVLALVGELDLIGQVRLRAELARLAELEPPLLVLDLCGLRFVDAGGLGALVAARKQLAAWSGRLMLAGASARVCRLLRIVRLTESLPVHGSVEEAIAAAVLSPPPAPVP